MRITVSEYVRKTFAHLNALKPQNEGVVQGVAHPLFSGARGGELGGREIRTSRGRVVSIVATVAYFSILFPSTYDTSRQLSSSRMGAASAMKAAGLPTDVETAYRKLEEIANERGPDDTRHFDALLERLGLSWNSVVIPAGVVEYRATSPIYLTPFPDTVTTLLKLRDSGHKLGVHRRAEL